jgi:hypothetical protein
MKRKLILKLNLGSYLGCYKDSRIERDLNSSNIPFNSSQMTAQFCIEKCKDISMKYAGLQIGYC